MNIKHSPAFGSMRTLRCGVFRDERMQVLVKTC